MSTDQFGAPRETESSIVVIVLILLLLLGGIGGTAYWVMTVRQQRAIESEMRMREDAERAAQEAAKRAAEIQLKAKEQ